MKMFTFMTVPRQLPLRMRGISVKSYREDQNTHFMANNIFPNIVPLMR